MRCGIQSAAWAGPSRQLMSAATSWVPGAPVNTAGLGVVLRSLSPADVDQAFIAHLRDPHVVRNLAVGRHIASLERDAVLRALATYDNRRRFFLGVWPQAGTQRIGFCLANVDTFGVAVITVAITDAALWRHGAAAAATYTLRTFLFDAARSIN